MTDDYTRFPVEAEASPLPPQDRREDRITLAFDRDEWEFIASAVGVSASWEDNAAHSRIWLRIHEALTIS